MAVFDVLSTIIPSAADHHQFLFLQLLLPLSIVLIILRRNKQKYSLPPCPPKLPLIGNIHQLIPPLHRSLRTLYEKHGPIFSLQLGTRKAVVVSSPEMAEQIFKTHDLTFASRPPSAAANAVNYGRSLNVSFTPYSDYWKWVRKLCITELLSSKRVQSFKSLINEELQNLINSITAGERDRSEIDLSDAVFSFGNDVMCRMVFGRKHSRDDRFREIFGEIQELVVSFFFEDYWPGLGYWVDEVIGIKGRLRKRMKELDVFLESMIEERISINIKEEDIDDRSDHLIDVLLRMMKDVNSEIEITKDHVKSILLDMFAAGTDTTATVLEWTMTELIKNPIKLQKAQDEVRRVVGSKRNVEESDIHQLDYLNMVLKESFRLHPPAPLLVPRESMEDCVIQNYYIPKGTRVFVNVWAIGRDEKYWDDPLEFRPERFIDGKVDFKGHDQFMLIPFGGGRRVCPGSNLGVYVAKIALANLLHHFDWELPICMHVNDLDMEEAIGLTVHRKNSLHLIAKSKRHEDSN